MRDGTCPKCGSNSVYSSLEVEQKAKNQAMYVIPIKGVLAVSMAFLDTYVCTNCGYVESYVTDPKKLEEIGKEWPRVSAANA
jgi:predicted RNA-binding Zn-ribbon protein involved in translation (DUF1610 family)